MIEHRTSYFENGKEVKVFGMDLPNGWRKVWNDKEPNKFTYFHKIHGGTFVYNK